MNLDSFIALLHLLRVEENFAALRPGGCPDSDYCGIFENVMVKTPVSSTIL